VSSGVFSGRQTARLERCTVGWSEPQSRAVRVAEQRLRDSEITFRQLVESSPFGVYVVDADFRIVQVSAGARKRFEMRASRPSGPCSILSSVGKSEVEPEGTRFLRANAAMCRFLGYSEEELLSRRHLTSRIRTIATTAGSWGEAWLPESQMFSTWKSATSVRTERSSRHERR
jgi:PAS domain-containing protein